MKFFVVLFIILCANSFECAKILGVFPFESMSHQVVYHALCKELAKRGHELTVLTTHRDNDSAVPQALYRQIVIKWNLTLNAVDEILNIDKPVYLDPMYKKLIDENFNYQMAYPEVRALLDKETEHFDLLIIESYSPCYFGFAHRYKVPYIGFASFNSLISSHDAVGNPSHPVLYPSIYGAPFGKVSLVDKLTAVYHEYYIRFHHYFASRRRNEIVWRHFGSDAPSVSELERKMDLHLVNINHILAESRPVVPATVYLGGIHLSPKTPLPKDLETFLNNSSRGVIYMSLGSVVLSKHLAPETLEIFIEVFRQTPFNVIWKFEGQHLANKPLNVFVSKWLPQKDLLGHKNIKAFITQTGQQSLDEAIHNEVPLICLPFVSDQEYNAAKVERYGIGVGLKPRTLTRELLNGAIRKVTEDVRYKENIKKLNMLISDQPMTGMERAVWWTEYVLRHKGAKHLRSPSADATFIEYYMLDVLAFVTCIVLFFVVLIYLISKTIRNMYYESLKISANKKKL